MDREIILKESDCIIYNGNSFGLPDIENKYAVWALFAPK